MVRALVAKVGSGTGTLVGRIGNIFSSMHRCLPFSSTGGNPFSRLAGSNNTVVAALTSNIDEGGDLRGTVTAGFKRSGLSPRKVSTTKASKPHRGIGTIANKVACSPMVGLPTNSPGRARTTTGETLSTKCSSFRGGLDTRVFRRQELDFK